MCKGSVLSACCRSRQICWFGWKAHFRDYKSPTVVVGFACMHVCFTVQVVLIRVPFKILLVKSPYYVLII